MFGTILESYRSAFRGLSREVWILSVVSLVNRCGSMVIPFLAVYLTTRHGYEPSEAGTLLMFYGVGAMVGIELGGRLTDRFGWRPVMIGSLVGNGFARFALGGAGNAETITAAAVVLGILSEGFRPANAVALAAHARPDELARAFGLNRLAINIGWTIGPLLGGLLAQFDYGWLFAVDGLTCIAAALTLRALLPPREREDPGGSDGGPVTSPWRDRLFVCALVMLMLQGVVFFQVQSTFPLYLNSVRGHTELTIGALLSVNTLVIILFEMVLVHAISKRNPLRVVGVAGALVGLGFGLLPYAHTHAAIVGTVIVWTAGEMLAFPMIQAWVAKRSSSSTRGRYMSAFGLTYSVASVIAPVAGTFLFEELGPDSVWHACLAIGAVQLVGFVLLARRGK